MITLIGRPDAVLTNDIANMISAQSGIAINKIHPDDFLADKFNRDDEFLITYVTEMPRRREIVNKINTENLKRTTFVHSSVIVDPTAIIQPGTFIGPFSVIAYEAVVNYDCMIAPYNLVSHRANIGNGTVTNPGAIIAGAVKMGEFCLVGLRSTTVDRISICNDVVIGPGSLVSKNITEPGRYLGSPARRG